MGLHFSLKSTVLFIMLFMELCFSLKSTAFHETALFTEKHCTFHCKATKTADSTQISHDLVFHRVQRDDQLGISYIVVVFGGVCMCIWYMNAHICLHYVLN